MASMSAPPPPPPVPTVEMLSTSNSSPKQDQNASKDGKKWTVVEETNEMVNWKRNYELNFDLSFCSIDLFENFDLSLLSNYF